MMNKIYINELVKEILNIEKDNLNKIEQPSEKETVNKIIAVIEEAFKDENKED